MFQMTSCLSVGHDQFSDIQMLQCFVYQKTILHLTKYHCISMSYIGYNYELAATEHHIKIVWNVWSNVGKPVNTVNDSYSNKGASIYMGL